VCVCVYVCVCVCAYVCVITLIDSFYSFLLLYHITICGPVKGCIIIISLCVCDLSPGYMFANPQWTNLISISPSDNHTHKSTISAISCAPLDSLRLCVCVCVCVCVSVCVFIYVYVCGCMCVCFMHSSARESGCRYDCYSGCELSEVSRPFGSCVCVCVCVC